MPETEADTCRTLVTPRIYAAGWTDEQICEQRTFTDGRIIVVGNRIRRRRQKHRPEARVILNVLLDKYTEFGIAQFIVPDILEVPPISEQGNLVEIAGRFGGVDQLRDAVNELQTLLYAA